MSPIMPKGPVVAFGELLFDVIRKPGFELPVAKIGGAPGNFCHRLAQLGVSTRIVSKVGKDELGDKLCADIAGGGVDVSLLQKDSNLPTGTVDVLLNEEGNPHFTIRNQVAYDNLNLTAPLREAVQNASLIYFGTLVQRSNVSRRVLLDSLDLAARAIKFVDLNLRENCYSADTVRASLQRANIVKLNEKEVGLVGQLLDWNIPGENGTAQNYLMERLGDEFSNIHEIVITLGEDGARACCCGSRPISIPGPKISVVDTIGAGDSFCAGYVKMRLQEQPLEICCAFGNLMGALTASHEGAMPTLSDDAIENFVASHASGRIFPGFTGTILDFAESSLAM